MDEVIGTRKVNFHNELMLDVPDLLPHTGYFYHEGDILAFVQDGNSAYFNSGGEKYNLKPISHGTWQIVELPSITFKKARNFAGYSLHENEGTIGTAVTRLTRQSRNNIWDARIGKSFVTTRSHLGTISMRLQYDSDLSIYYNVIKVNNDDPLNFYVKTVTDNILQVQGKGRSSGIVFDYLDDDTVSFSGLKFEHKSDADIEILKAADKQQKKRSLIMNTDFLKRHNFFNQTER